MSEKKVTFRNGKAYLETNERVKSLFVRDVINVMPIHKNKDYDKKELKKLLEKLVKEKDCEDSLKWSHRLLINALKEYREDGDLEEFINDSIGFKRVEEFEELDSLLTVMNTTIQLEEGTLFKHVWEYIEKDYDIFNVLFTDSLGSFDLNNWIEHAKIPHEKSESERNSEKTGVGMHKLQCYWNYSVMQDDYSQFKGEFGGWGTHVWETWENGAKVKDEIQECAYGLSFTPINAILDYPFELKEEVKINHLEIWDGKKYSFPKLKPEINTKKYWTPYLMIEAILWEISFMGTPQQQDEKYDEIKETVDKVKSGEFKTYPIEDLGNILDVEENEKEIEEGLNDDTE